MILIAVFDCFVSHWLPVNHYKLNKNKSTNDCLIYPKSSRKFVLCFIELFGSRGLILNIHFLFDFIALINVLVNDIGERLSVVYNDVSYKIIKNLKMN